MFRFFTSWQLDSGTSSPSGRAARTHDMIEPSFPEFCGPSGHQPSPKRSARAACYPIRPFHRPRLRGATPWSGRSQPTRRATPDGTRGRPAGFDRIGRCVEAWPFWSRCSPSSWRSLARSCSGRKKGNVIQPPNGSGAFEFVVIAGLRAAQLMRGCTPRVDSTHKIITTAQLEVAAGKVSKAVSVNAARAAE